MLEVKRRLRRFSIGCGEQDNRGNPEQNGSRRRMLLGEAKDEDRGAASGRASACAGHLEETRCYGAAEIRSPYVRLACAAGTPRTFPKWDRPERILFWNCSEWADAAAASSHRGRLNSAWTADAANAPAAALGGAAVEEGSAMLSLPGVR
ncbi:hypothetical protein MTO96_003021 [Rhipicephalus appendiculatus]